MGDRRRKLPEPAALKRGKAFHRAIQQEWRVETEGRVLVEKHILTTSGRTGRVDVLVDDDSPGGCLAIVEIRATDWDKIKEANLRRNIRRQVRQVWRYIESQILGGEYVSTGLGKDVCPGIVFPHIPKSQRRRKLVEESFADEGIVVVWHDEKIR